MTRISILLVCGGAIACGSSSQQLPTAATAATLSSSPAVSATAPQSAINSSTQAGQTTLRGPLSNLSGACPAVTFSVDKTSVSTTSSTQFLGGTCAGLANGTPVLVEGTLQNGAVLALGVRLPPAPSSSAHLHGAISGLQGSCPTVTFSVENTSVSTTASTQFVVGTCAQLANGAAVLVEGTAENNGSMTAVAVRLAPPPSSSVHLQGAISGLQGSCPTVTFAVDNATVSTTSSTHFADGACPGLANGTQVLVEGMLQNGTVTALGVRLVTSPPPGVLLRGSLSGLQGSCPAVTFSLDNTTVSTASTTQFAGGTCANLTNGSAVVVQGAPQNGTVVASLVGIRP